MQNSFHFKLILLLIATFFWGLGFPAARWTLSDYTPLWSTSIRFVLASVFFIPILIYFKSFKRPLREQIPPLLCGLLIFVSLFLQTSGLHFTSLAKSGFFTIFYVLFTPLLSTLMRKTKFSLTYWFLVSFSILGALFLCELKLYNFNFGDFLTLCSALTFSIHILLIGKIANKYNALELNGLQTLYVAIISVIVGFLFEDLPSFDPLLNFSNFFIASPLLGFLILSFFSSFLAFSIQVFIQKSISAHIVSLTFLAESVFAAFFGYYFFNEGISLLGLMGCLMILTSIGLTPFIIKNSVTEH